MRLYRIFVEKEMRLLFGDSTSELPDSRYDAIPLTFTELSGVDSITRSKVCDSNSVQGTETFLPLPQPMTICSNSFSL